MGRIVVIGSSNTDLTVRVESIPSPGQTLLGGDVIMAGGGKGANQAVAVARLGGELEFVAKVGDDMFGHDSIFHLQRDGIDTSHIFVDKEVSSGVALICVDRNAENAIAVAPGANMRLGKDEIDMVRKDIETAQILLLQLESPMETIEYASEIAARAGVKVVLNPAPAARIPDSIIRNAFLLTPNETECEVLSGMKIESDRDAEKAGRLLLEKGAKNVIVTLGTKGSMIVTPNGCEKVPAYRVHAVDTVAAGDTYNGALCVALAEGKSLKEAAEFASRASAIAVTRPGAQPSVPTRTEVEEFDESKY